MLLENAQRYRDIAAIEGEFGTMQHFMIFRKDAGIQAQRQIAGANQAHNPTA